MDKRVKSIEIRAEREDNKIVAEWRANVNGFDYGADVWLLEKGSWADLEKAFRLLLGSMLDSIPAILKAEDE